MFLPSVLAPLSCQQASTKSSCFFSVDHFPPSPPPPSQCTVHYTPADCYCNQYKALPIYPPAFVQSCGNVIPQSKIVETCVIRACPLQRGSKNFLQKLPFQKRQPNKELHFLKIISGDKSKYWSENKSINAHEINSENCCLFLSPPRDKVTREKDQNREELFSQ